jgi:hypothetical protein
MTAEVDVLTGKKSVHVLPAQAGAQGARALSRDPDIS